MEILRVLARIERAGAADHVAECDAVFMNGTLCMVFEWTDNHPTVTVPLNSSYLQNDHGIPGIDFVYNQAVRDPRVLS